jgi:GIY-YIG catalytic domain
MADKLTDFDKEPPFETRELRAQLALFLDTLFDTFGTKIKIGNFQWGVYAFYDYDGEPIYIGQTNEKCRTRIRRHLTNQRTDAVAMSVLDPFEVYEIEIWPLTEYEGTNRSDKNACEHLNALERQITELLVQQSQFNAVLNEKDPPPGSLQVAIPKSLRGRIVSDKVSEIRSHPDFRIARRALTISRLAQVIAERKVQGGLRRVLATQAKRLGWLATRRFEALGGEASVAVEGEAEV